MSFRFNPFTGTLDYYQKASASTAPEVIDLTDGLFDANNDYTFTHNLGYKYFAAESLRDDNDITVTGYTITPLSTTQAKINLTGLRPISNTWKLSVK